MDYELSSVLTNEESTAEYMEVQAGDVLVFTAPSRLSQSTLDGLQKRVEQLFPGVKALILDEGLQLDQVLRPVSEA